MRIELRDIHKYFGPVRANDGISLQFESGKIYGLLGENGAGKSTLMKILSGYQLADRGEIVMEGATVQFKSPDFALRRGVGMVYQDPLDFPPFRIIENYLLGRSDNFLLDYKSAMAELKELLAKYEFSLDLNAYIDTLSLGERQQLELVRLLAGGVQLLILDEPTTGISAEQKDILFNSMRQLAHEEGKTLILVSHKLDEVQELCDHAYILRKGKFVGGTDLPCPTDRLVEMMFGQVPERTDRPAFEVGKFVLEVKDLSVETYRLSVHDINFSVHAGEVFGLAGLEGSGQRLLLQACGGLQLASRGHIFIAGEDVTHWTHHRMRNAGIDYVAAGRLEEGLVAGLSLSEHVVLSLPVHTFLVDWGAAQKETAQRIEQYQIVGRPESTADELSGGNQQRLLFALLNSPLKLLLLEHPTRGLDIRSAEWIWQLLYQRREQGTAIVFMSADLDEIIERSDRIAVFSGGVMSRIVDAKETTVDELGHLIGGRL